MTDALVVDDAAILADWERQFSSAGGCSHPIRLRGKVTAIDRATGEAATTYDTGSEPSGVLHVACGNRREAACPSCSAVYKRDARQLVPSRICALRVIRRAGEELGHVRARYFLRQQKDGGVPAGTVIGYRSPCVTMLAALMPQPCIG